MKTTIHCTLFNKYYLLNSSHCIVIASSTDWILCSLELVVRLKLRVEAAREIWFEIFPKLQALDSRVWSDSPNSERLVPFEEALKESQLNLWRFSIFEIFHYNFSPVSSISVWSEYHARKDHLIWPLRWRFLFEMSSTQFSLDFLRNALNFRFQL